jgi:hypothetical protein
MTRKKIIRIHPAAPVKPALGAPCNGCGVCCLVELCPLGIVRYQRRRGPCPALRWLNDERRYACGMLLDVAHNPLVRWWVGRSIAAGRGCDSSAKLL